MKTGKDEVTVVRSRNVTVDTFFMAHSVLRRCLSKSTNIIFFAANVINATLRDEDVACVIDSVCVI